MRPAVRRAACVAAFLLAASCGPSGGKKDGRGDGALGGDRDKQIDALGGIAENYRAKDAPADADADRRSKIPGMSDYDDAREAVAANELKRAVASLQRAVAANGECAEYWYNLGAAQANLAIATVNDSESDAVRIFGESVDSKRRALELMNEGKFQFYDADEQAQVKRDAEMGLMNAEEVLRDPVALATALKMYADAR